MLSLRASNKVPGGMKQGGGPDSARGPCVCHLCDKGSASPKLENTQSEGPESRVEGSSTKARSRPREQ